MRRWAAVCAATGIATRRAGTLCAARLGHDCVPFPGRRIVRPRPKTSDGSMRTRQSKPQPPAFPTKRLFNPDVSLDRTGFLRHEDLAEPERVVRFLDRLVLASRRADLGNPFLILHFRQVDVAGV